MNPHKTALITGLAFSGFLISLFGINLSLRTYDGSKRVVYVHEHSDQGNYCFELKSRPDSLLIQHDQSSPPQGTLQHTDHSVIKREKFTFLSNPPLIIWVVVMSMMLGTAFGLCLPLIQRIIGLYHHFNRKHRAIAKRSQRLLVYITVLLVIILVLLNANSVVDILTAFDITREFQIIFYSTRFANLVIYLTLAVAGIATFGLFFINVCIPNIAESKVKVKCVTERFKKLSDAMRFFLTSIAILIIYSIITSSLFQQVLSRSITFEG